MITAIDDQTIGSSSDVSSIVLAEQPGTTVTVDYTDSYGSSQATTVTLADGPAQ